MRALSFLAFALALMLCANTHAMPLIQPGQITTSAVASGDWNQSGNWSSGVPGPGDVAHIPDGISMTIGGVDTQLQHMLVDGLLRFAPNQSTTLRIDTLQVGMTGVLEIGTVGQPIASSAQVRVVFSSDSDIDINWDPDLLSRGLVGDGQVSIHGQAKTPHARVAVDPMTGETQLQLAQAPQGWQVGDRIILTGTRYFGWKWDNDIRAVRYHGTQDEVRYITAIDGATITLDTPLEFDHATPRSDLKAAVANMTRNVMFESDGGAGTSVHRRGHVMLRHHTDFDVRYAAFIELGRTDKSVASFDLDQLGTITPQSNVRGRYPLHFHMSGIDDPRNPAIAIGNAVFASPGWGFVHHASNATMHNNVSFDTFGAGMVAETGDEIGAWTRNLAIKAEGNSAFNPKNGNDTANFDMGRTGAGFWFQGRMVRAVGNIAASVNHGFVYLHRGTRMHSFPGSAFMLPEALPRSGNTAPDDAPILNFHDNESFASTVGLYVVKANPNQGHDIHSHLSNFTAWEVRAGAALEYTSHYLLENFDIVGTVPGDFHNPEFGIDFGTNTSDMVIRGARIADMPTGIGLGKDFTDAHPPEVNQYLVIDAQFEGVGNHYSDFDNTIDRILDEADLVHGRMQVELNNGEPLEYLDPATSAGTGIDFIGSKLDSTGSNPVPAGTDQLGVGNQDMIAICAQDGYYRAGNGDPYAVVEEYFTDRATGTIHKMGFKVFLGPDVEARLGDQFHAWRDAFERGPIDLDSQAPVTADNHAATDVETDVIINVLANDSDPDSDPLTVDGVFQPHNGLVFNNNDGTLTYRPDFDFRGTDSFRYWASDGQGNFTPATVTVEVGGGLVFGDRFEP